MYYPITITITIDIECFDKRNLFVQLPDYDDRNIVDLIEKYSDAHRSGLMSSEFGMLCFVTSLMKYKKKS